MINAHGMNIALAILVSMLSLQKLLELRKLISSFTVVSSVYWMIAANVVVGLSAVVTAGGIPCTPGFRSALQIFAATMLLTPAVAILGARNPGNVVWQFFVVSPLVFVLMWPATSELIGSRGREVIQISGPASMGITLVYLMGFGVTVGSALMPSALLTSAAMAFCVAPTTSLVSGESALPLVSPWLIFLSHQMTVRVIRRRLNEIGQTGSSNLRNDALWKLICDLYGPAWKRRIQDRVNQFSKSERWQVVLTDPGFRNPDGHLVSDPEMEKPAFRFHWVLSRFVSENWLTQQVCRSG